MELKPGYKQTEEGIIPNDWEVKALGSIGSVIRGSSPRPKADKRFYGGNVPRLMVEDVTRDRKFVTPSIDFLTLEGAKRSRPCKRGTLTVVCSGTPAVVGLPSFLAVDACIHDGMLALTNLAPTVDPDYLFHRLTSRQEQLYAAATHGGTFVNLTTTGFGAFTIALPPTTEEQRALAGVLSDVDALIGAMDQLIAKKRDLKLAAMQQLLTGHQRLPGFSGTWEVKRLGEVGRFCKGKGIKRDDIVTDGVPCIRYGGIYTHHHDYIRQFRSFILRSVADQSQRLQRGDLLFAGSGETAEEIGKCVAFLGEEEAYAGGDIVICSPSGQDSLYLGYLMNHTSISSQKARMGQGDAVVHISARNLAELKLNLPKLAEQTAIAGVLSDMDAELAALEQRLAKTRDLKQGMMQELLTGRTRLV
jgi:type I restriction enzyme, S subunit